jgi:simple sugar transport system substrate-binding protein
LIAFLILPLASSAKTNGKVVLGFSQIGAESAWRIANTKSVKHAAAQSGVFLDFSDAQQKQANQIRALKTFIMQKVDVIAFAPVIETGWRSVLLQARKAKIPVILLDRNIDAKDADLYTTLIGSDFREEGRRAAQCLVEEMKRRGLVNDSTSNTKDEINIVELRGTEGSAPAIERSAGFHEALRDYPQFKIIRSEVADFKEAQGKEVMEIILRRERALKRRISAVYSHNDNMALGAISSIEAAGLKPGKDITIASIDAINDAMIAMKEGKINCIIEYSPLLGPQLIAAVKELVESRPLPHKITIQGKIFTSITPKHELPQREY